MQISTTARHCDLDPEVRLFAQKRLEKLERFARDIREAHLIVSVEGYRHSAEITLRLKRHELVSRQESNQPRAAIERAADRLEKQLRRLKEQRQARKRGGRSANGGAPAPAGFAEPELAGDESPNGGD